MIDLSVTARYDWPESLRPLFEATKHQIEVSLAGAQLAKLRRDAKARRRQRIYTGVVGRRRAWRHMQVVLADGRIAELLVARRGAAMVAWQDDFAIKPERVGGCRTDDLRRYKVPAAVILGGLKKGRKERPSAKKGRCARGNGCRPVRPGSRPRGRPRAQPAAQLSPNSARTTR